MFRSTQRTRFRVWRLALKVALVSVNSAAVAAVVGYVYLRQSLPQIDGEVRLPGLNVDVTVTRDAGGVAYIRAENELDAAFALGFVHAQERLFQMEFMRRLAAGRLAEVVGIRAMDSDRFMRTLGIYRLAEASYAHLPEDVRGHVDAYVAGVNAFLQQRTGPLPIDLLLSRVEPEPWRPADTLVWGRLMAMRLTDNWRTELLRLRLTSRLSYEQIDDLFDGDDGGAGVPLASGPSVDPSVAAALWAAIPEELRSAGASNIWAISGRHTDSGRPLLANDPHLELTLPSHWFLARIETPGLTLVGATTPGVPVMILGHNGHAAWGMTTTHGDNSDLFMEVILSDGTYIAPDGRRPIATRTEIIGIKDAAPLALTVRTTRHGPIVSDVIVNAPAAFVLALSHPGLAEDDRTIEAAYRLNRVRTWTEFAAAMDLFHAPQQNVGYADADGTIGLMAAGRVPIRKNGDGWMPAAGAGGGADWIAWVPPRDLPAVRDPPSGRVINANNTVIDGDYPYRLGREFAEPYRARRIASLLIGIDKATPSDMAAIQLDVRSTMVDAALPILLRDTPRTADTGAVLDLLSRWDGSMRHDRPEPLIFTAWWRHLIAALYADELKDLATAVSPRPAVVLRSLNSRQIWCDDVATPTVVETCPSRLQLALARALAELRAAYGNDPAQWRWGVPHRSRLRHPVLSRIPVIGAWFELSVPTHGDRYTVNVGGHPIMDPKDPYGHTSGAGYRAIYDLAALDRSLFQIVGGQSGNPLSPHFGDRMTDWAEGRYATISAEPAAVAGRLRLRPDHAR